MGFTDVTYILENPYAKALLVFITCVILARALLYLTKVYLAFVVNRHHTIIENVLLRRLRYPLSWLIIVFGLFFTIRPINITNPIIINIIKSTAVILLVHISIIISDILLDIWQHKWKQNTSSSTFDEEILPLFHTFLKVILIFLGLLFILNIWGVHVGPLVASLGIIGIAVGFALQGSLANVLGGVSLVFDRAFKLGDLIKLESGDTGEVVRIGLRSTSIKTFDNETIIIPNNQLSNSRIINYAQPDNILRIIIPVSVVYGSDVEKVRKVLLDCVRHEKGILTSPRYEIRFIKMADYSLDFELIFFIESYKKKFYFTNKITSKVYKAFGENSIKIPFPTRTLYINQMEKCAKQKRKKSPAKRRKG